MESKSDSLVRNNLTTAQKKESELEQKTLQKKLEIYKQRFSAALRLTLGDSPEDEADFVFLHSRARGEETPGVKLAAGFIEKGLAKKVLINIGRGNRMSSPVNNLGDLQKVLGSESSDPADLYARLNSAMDKPGEAGGVKRLRKKDEYGLISPFRVTKSDDFINSFPFTVDYKIASGWIGGGNYARKLIKAGVLPDQIDYIARADNTPQETERLIDLLKSRYRDHPDQDIKLILITVPQQLTRVLMGTIARLNQLVPPDILKHFNIHTAYPEVDFDEKITGNQGQGYMSRADQAYQEMIRIPEYQLNRNPRDNCSWEELNEFYLTRDGPDALNKLEEKFNHRYVTDPKFAHMYDLLAAHVNRISFKDIEPHWIKNWLDKPSD